MAKLTVTDRKGVRHELDGKAGERLMFVLRDDYNLPVEGTCGGCASCGTCHVFVDEAWVDRLPKRQDDEEQMLDSLRHVDERRSRLSCQIIVDASMDGLAVTLAPEE
ncbi:MAG: 2Fe-2S iron-sulfur cluster binding domain-containing protein [Alphaproteobacteria bacterium]|nr:2Fe-2S iron-sulfur cluster binding domain-containing protein [Alphaproteobacteria bacterium]